MSILRPFTEPSVCTKGWQWDIAALKSTGESCPHVLAQLGTISRWLLLSFVHREENLFHLEDVLLRGCPSKVRLSEMILSMSM